MQTTDNFVEISSGVPMALMHQRGFTFDLEGSSAGGQESTDQGATTPESTDGQAVSEVPESDDFNEAWANAFGKADSGSQTKAGNGDATADDADATTETPNEGDGAGDTLDGDAADEGKQTPTDDKAQADAAKVKMQEAIATLPRTLKSAAERAGYSDEDLAKDIETFGADRVAATLERWHSGFNDLSSRYSQLGRNVQPPQQQQQAPAQQQQAAESAPGTIDALFEPKAMAEFEAEYGKGIVEKVLKPLRAELQPLREIRVAWENQQRASLQQEINSIFDGIGGEYEALYGKGGHAQIADEAKTHRNAVLREADLILMGAERAGVAMNNKEAIERAHALYVAPRRAEFERKALAARVKGRNGSITARPTGRRTPTTVGGGKNKSTESAINAVSKREAELGVEFFED